MRFMMIVKHAENQGPPPKKLIDAIRSWPKKTRRKARWSEMAGSGPPRWAPVSGFPGASDGDDGPFTEAKEVVGGYAQFELNSKEEAVEGAVRFMERKEHWPGWEGETEVRQMFGPDDFACKRQPPGVPHPLSQRTRKEDGAGCTGDQTWCDRSIFS